MKVFYDTLGKLTWREPINLYYQGVLIENGIVPNLELGIDHVVTDQFGTVYPIIYRGIVHTAWFDATFDATHERLGSFVEADETTFSVFAPTAIAVYLRIDNARILMHRKDNGVYTHTIAQNLHGTIYNYEVHVNGDVNITTDIYAKASMPNGSASVVVDFNQMHLETNPIESRSGVILETQVRDFSMDPNVAFKYRGKFLGMLESHGDYGMQHILDMGVSHIQLMPINDFGSVDELNPLENYNWGYDPMQYMALEGSYCTDPNDPLRAISEFSTLVNGYHKHGIGVNVDVVFNHVYEVAPSAFHQTVPYYYFRYDNVFEHYNGTFCGNEVASERPMVRKMIVDACRYYVETFRIDGYRFDLMGIMDIDTMLAIQESIPNTTLYGEGWHMASGLPDSLKASMENTASLPGIGHFNDQFRNLVGGDTDARNLGYVDTGLTPLIKESILGSRNLFADAALSINYIECHDNYALADKVVLNHKQVEAIDVLNALVILSKGVPFMQIGQSFFRNKQRNHNSYNLPDAVNQIDWSFVRTYRDYHENVKRFIEFRTKNKNYSINFVGDEIVFKGTHGAISVTPNHVIFQDE